MSQQVQITDGTIDAGVEGSAHALQCSRAVHYRIEHSNGWISSHLFTSVASSASVYFHIKAGSTMNPHGNFTISTEAGVTVEFYENPTLTNDGTALAENCLNRQTPVTADTSCFYTPTVTDDGTQLEINLIGTSNTGVTDIGDSITDRGYWVLKKNESYLIKVTNTDQASKDIGIAYVWHEHATTFPRHPPDKA